MGLRRVAAEQYFRPAVESIKDATPGIVLAHNAPVVVRLLRGQPHVVLLYAHNDVLRTYGRREAARALEHAAGIIAVSDALASQLSAHLPRSLRGLVHVVRNGVDTNQFTPAPSGRAPGPLRVLFIGRMIPEKGADILLRAAANLDRSDLDFTLVGSHGFDPNAALTAYEQGLRRLADAVPGNVEFLPFVDRSGLPALLQRADVLVVPSRWNEPLTLTVGEGLASGLVVIASSRGGIPEALGTSGLLFDPDVPEDLSALLARVADDPPLRAEMSKKARAMAGERDWAWAWRELEQKLQILVPQDRE
jgi:glycosyltransferase involved in cell wall biosynthesis